jgi:nucleoside-diphosphate-sugar epimerase
LNTDGIFLFCSTSEIYSGLTKENITENDIGNTSTNHPRSCYIESKRCGEAICYGMHEQYGKNVKIARISSVYGPGTKKNDQRVMSELIKKAICDKKIELIDSGSSIRTFGYVTDIVEMLFNILLQSKDITYNVTGITEISIAKLAEYICDYTKCPLSIPSSGNTLIGNPQRVSISIDKYQQEFNKISFVSIEHGLKNTIQYLEGLYV